MQATLQIQHLAVIFDKMYVDHKYIAIYAIMSCRELSVCVCEMYYYLLKCIMCEVFFSFLSFSLSASSPRKVYDTREAGQTAVTQIDFDDDKYRRRPALSWFAQILK